MPPMLRLAYLVSQFPEAHESFITREVQAVGDAPDVELTIFSLKHCRDRFIQDEAKPFLDRTRYPSFRASAGGFPTLVSTPGARRCLREVLAAYGRRPLELAKALGTLVRTAAVLPALRRLGSPHVHAHWATMPALGAYFLKHAAGLRYSITAHAWDIYADTTMLREKVEAADFVATCTGANRRFLETTIGSEGKIVVSYHGLNFGSIPPPCFGRSGELSILAVGRLVEQKGFIHLIEASALLLEQGRKLTCQIVGDGPLRGELAREITRRGLDGRVTIAGRQPLTAVFDAYRRCSVLCVPSVVARDGDRDGIPNVIIEAMSQGLPVVASDVSGIPEIVRPGRTGWLVPPGEVSGLADAIGEVMDRPDEARQRAMAGHELVREQFDAGRNAASLLTLFRDSAASASLRSPGG